MRGRRRRAVPYDRRPETLTLPAGAYTLTVESAEPKAAVWDDPVYAARQEVLIDRNATVEVGEVLCTPAAVGVALVFDPAFGTQSTATVDCGGEALAFTTSESRTGWFAVGTARTLTLTVEGTAGEERPCRSRDATRTCRPDNSTASPSRANRSRRPTSNGSATTPPSATKPTTNSKRRSSSPPRPASAPSPWRSSPKRC
ncbi:MAG: DUF4493 domain-containing protein [Alistipes communis]